MHNVSLVGSLSVEARKSRAGNTYYALVCDLGYTKKIISVNLSDIAELLGLSVVELIKTLDGGK